MCRLGAFLTTLQTCMPKMIVQSMENSFFSRILFKLVGILNPILEVLN